MIPPFFVSVVDSQIVQGKLLFLTCFLYLLPTILKKESFIYEAFMRGGNGLFWWLFFRSFDVYLGLHLLWPGCVPALAFTGMSGLSCPIQCPCHPDRALLPGLAAWRWEVVPPPPPAAPNPLDWNGDPDQRIIYSGGKKLREMKIAGKISWGEMENFWFWE